MTDEQLYYILEPEQWRKIIGHDDYIVSNRGRILSLKFGKKRIKIPHLREGYELVTMNTNGKQGSRAIHQMVLESFLGTCPEGMECNHKDGNKCNNHINNLEWVTPSENQKHAYLIGLKKGMSGKQNPMYGKKHTIETKQKMSSAGKLRIGEKNNSARLKEKEVWLIKKLLYGGVTQNLISKIFKVSTSNISSIATDLTWRNCD